VKNLEIREDEWDFDRLTGEFAGRLIYFVGNARGGSTFGNAAVSIHRDLLEVRWNDRTFVEIWPFRNAGYYDEGKAMEVLGPDGVRRLHAHVETLCRTRNLRDVLCFFGILYWLMHAPHTKLSSLRGWCFKANTWQGIDLVKETIPGARLLVIERDPRSTVLSMAKVLARNDKRTIGDADLVRGAMDWLRNATEFADCLSRHRTTSLAFRYEDLVNDPAETLNRIYDFLGLSMMDPEAIFEALSRMTYSRTQMHREPETIKGLRKDSLDRWRQELSKEQVAIITTLTAPAAHLFDYAAEIKPGNMRQIIWALSRGTFGAQAVRQLLKLAYCRYKLARSRNIDLISLDQTRRKTRSQNI
jgi:hypothetical protein